MHVVAPPAEVAGRLVAANSADLAQERPAGADDAIADDLPNEDDVPNHHPPDSAAAEVDNHDVLTGTNEAAKLFDSDARSTCNDWTSAVGDAGQPHCGHSWPRSWRPERLRRHLRLRSHALKVVMGGASGDEAMDTSESDAKSRRGSGGSTPRKERPR